MVSRGVVVGGGGVFFWTKSRGCGAAGTIRRGQIGYGVFASFVVLTDLSKYMVRT
jgi:hypothetical protein